VVVGSTLAENKLISLLLLKYLWSEGERMEKPSRHWAPKRRERKQPIMSYERQL